MAQNNVLYYSHEDIERNLITEMKKKHPEYTQSLIESSMFVPPVTCSEKELAELYERFRVLRASSPADVLHIEYTSH